MNLDRIFDVFSRRNIKIEPFVQNAPKTLRSKILLYCKDLFTKNAFGHMDYSGEFWDEIHQMLLIRHGKFQLSDGHPKPQNVDTMTFLLSCNDEEFFDFIEYIFKVTCLFHASIEEDKIVADINKLFASENIGYELTEFIKEESIETISDAPFSGRPGRVIKTIAYPKVIKKDDEIIHTTAIKPALDLLDDPKFITANLEYRDALEDYRKGDYGDCLTKCCSAFESVMKIICDKRKWKYKQTDTASILLSTIINQSGINPFFEQPLIIIATLRNKLSKSHGAGVVHKEVNQNIAQYSLSSTAAAIVFLVNETK